MIVKEYTVIIRVEAEHNDDFPSITALVSGINDGLPKEWFSMEGDAFEITGWQFPEVNNPKYIGIKDPTDDVTTWGDVSAAADTMMRLANEMKTEKPEGIRIYEVGRDADGVWARVNDGESTTPLIHLMRHSPDGFEYGYGGSGPSDLARSIVGDVYGTDHPNQRGYMALKMEWVATLGDGGPFRISEILVRTIVELAIHPDTIDQMGQR